MSETVLNLQDIHKTYNVGLPNQVEVLRGVDLSLKKGELVALVAASGAGKSTLLHIAGLLDQPNRGEVVFCGEPVQDANDSKRTQLRRDDIGFIYQFHHLLPEFDALENIILPQLAAGIGAKQAKERALSLLARVGLKERAGHRPAALSGGEAQRVAFCRALANGPQLLLGDEPTGNLDPDTADQVFETLIDLVRSTGLSALIATHNLELAARMDRMIHLDSGRLRE